jgi:hypothetical protein
MRATTIAYAIITGSIPGRLFNVRATRDLKNAKALHRAEAICIGGGEEVCSAARVALRDE